jgi:hypothetical protein
MLPSVSRRIHARSARLARWTPLACVPGLLLLAHCGAKSPLIVREAGVIDAGAAASVRLIAPWSTSTTHTRSPRFEWVATSAQPVQIQWCADRQCAQLIHAQRAESSPAVPSVPLPTGKAIFWRVQSASGELSRTWELWIHHNAVRAERTDTAGSVLDLNGDGLADLAVGAVRATVDGGQNAGRVRVYYGHRSLDMSVASRVFEGRAGDQLGHAVASAGDVNGDGFADLLTAAVNADRPAIASQPALAHTGCVRLYLGGPSGIAAAPTLELYGNSQAEAFGSAITTAGDVNHDGYTDVLIGARLADGPTQDTGAARLYLGGPQGLAASESRTWHGTDAMEFFGLSLASGADLNADGLSDFVVGGLFAMPGGMRQAGRALVYLSREGLAENTPSSVLPGQTAFDAFATSLSPLLDVDGDGYADLLVGARYADPEGVHDAGSVSLYRGASTGLSTVAALTVRGDHDGALFGHAIARVGDVDGDGIEELAVSAENGDSMSARGAGYVRVYFQGRFENTLRLGGRANRDIFGGSLAGGDLNGDGYAELVVGAYRAESGPLLDAGEVYVFAGSPMGLAAVATLTLSGGVAEEAFGYALAL